MFYPNRTHPQVPVTHNCESRRHRLDLVFTLGIDHNLLSVRDGLGAKSVNDRKGLLGWIGYRS